MTRTVIRLEELVNQRDVTQVTLRPEEPQDVSDYTSARELTCRPDAPPFADLAAVAPGSKAAIPPSLVRQVGENLYAGLTVHAGILEALDRASRTAVGTVHPILVVTEAIGAEALPFEVLYHPKAAFLGLDPRWPMARVVGFNKGTIARFVKLPLRVAVVLAAADRDGIPEWEALRKAVVASKLDVAVTVLAAQDSVADHIQIQSESWVTVRRVPLLVDDLITEIAKLRPHVVHIFSHGSATYEGFLEIATRNSVNLGDAPLYVTASDLARLRDLVWLVTLNACEGAAPAADVHSLAHSLVKNGVPAAIGMREVIDSADASEFCFVFYKNAFGALATSLLPGARISPDWSEPLRAARAALCNGQQGPTAIVASSYKPWTLPVFYRRSENFVVQAALSGLTISDDEQEWVFADIEKMQQLREGLAPNTPPPVVASIDAEIGKARQRLV
jgi:hypothetical protein